LIEQKVISGKDRAHIDWVVREWSKTPTHVLQGITHMHGNAETVPYPDASFDFAISEYGACLWADPQRWVPEAARLLRPGGRLHFLTNAFLLTLCVPSEDDLAAGDRLLRQAFGMYRMEWGTDHSVEFHLSHGDWIKLLRTSIRDRRSG
jgi:SAM-dependent methyltransferase